MIKAIKISAPPGDLWVSGDEERIVQVAFEKPAEAEELESPVLLSARDQLHAFFEGRSRTFDLPLDLRGTSFQLRVWQSLESIPYGNTITYSALARCVGCGTIARAVGTACGANRFPIVIPCHRVVASDGSLTGYLGGLEWKRWLLGLEGAEVRAEESLCAWDLGVA